MDDDYWSETEMSLKEAFGGIFHGINNMMSWGKWTGNRHNVNVCFSLGWNYKFILLMFGLKMLCQIMPVYVVWYTTKIAGTVGHSFCVITQHSWPGH